MSQPVRCTLPGRAIGVQEDKNTFVLRKKVLLKKPVSSALFRATALGVYFVSVNGTRVGENYMAPGLTSYKKMVQVQRYELKPLLSEGENTLSVTVNEGWYSGGYVGSHTKMFGDKPMFLGCLTLLYPDGTQEEIATDTSWEACECAIRSSGVYAGEVYDESLPCAPLTVQEFAFRKDVLVEQMCEPVTNHERFPVKNVIITPKGERVFDFGQNLAGVVEITSETPCNVTLQFAEILDEHGNFFTDNLRSASGMHDTFITNKGGIFAPEFTFHGFRFVKVTGELEPSQATAVARYTDMRRTGEIIASSPRFARLMNNVLWGLKGNFLDIPTDCPQRDERLGWTGDINVFCKTAAFHYDIRAIMNKWLADLRNDQTPTGELPYVIPQVWTHVCTAAAWCDAVAMVPWTLYNHYGEISFLADNYEAMKKYVGACERTTENGLVARGHQFGDWLALDNEKYYQDVCHGGTDNWFIANVFFSAVLDITAKTAKLLHRTEEAKQYSDRYKTLLRKIRSEYFTREGRLAVPTVTAQTIALHFNVVEKKHRARLARDLNDNVLKHDCHVTTGFIGTPYLLFALTDNGYRETARKVLFNSSYPGWLYEVDCDATTVWERWNSLMPDGSPNPDGMTSFNHYAYGSVAEYVFRRIAGIEQKGVGYKRVKLSPHPTKGLPDICASYETPYGKITAGYTYEKGKVRLFAEVPKGVSAEFYLPDEETPAATGSGVFSFTLPSDELHEAAFTDATTVYEIQNNPLLKQAFSEIFGNGFFTNAGWLSVKELRTRYAQNQKLGEMDFERHSEDKAMSEQQFDKRLKNTAALFDKLVASLLSRQA